MLSASVRAFHGQRSTKVVNYEIAYVLHKLAVTGLLPVAANFSLVFSPEVFNLRAVLLDRQGLAILSLFVKFSSFDLLLVKAEFDVGLIRHDLRHVGLAVKEQS
jgi:hypothetical protein